MVNPHAHHVVFKKGRGKKMCEYLDQSKTILEKHGIDWCKGPEEAFLEEAFLEKKPFWRSLSGEAFLDTHLLGHARPMHNLLI
jgi:hypothetical protein